MQFIFKHNLDLGSSDTQLANNLRTRQNNYNLLLYLHRCILTHRHATNLFRSDRVSLRRLALPRMP